MRRPVNGILLLDKPAGISSNGALQRVKRLFNAKKAGHTGSLDPIATGMLPICFGEATKFSQFLLESNKTYEVVAKLGVQTTTGDSEGTATQTGSLEGITEEKIEAVLQRYLGQIEQVPPMFSAVKYQGKPLYELARKGLEVERKARTITIFNIALDDLSLDEMRFTVHCSKGTYVRTLVEEIGKELGCFAHVIGLRRSLITPYENAVMYNFADLTNIFDRLSFAGLDNCLLPVETSVDTYPAVKLSSSAAFYLMQGQPVRMSLKIDSPLVRLMSEDAKFLGMGEVMPDGRVKPQRLVS